MGKGVLHPLLNLFRSLLTSRGTEVGAGVDSMGTEATTFARPAGDGLSPSG